MARVNVPFTQLDHLGDDIDVGETAFDEPDGAMFTNVDAQTVLVLQNDGAGTHVITFITPFLASGGLTVEDPTVSLLTGEKHVLGNFDPVVYNQPSGADVGKIYMDSDGDQSEVKAKVYRP